MTRKLHNTLMAALASCSLLVAGVMASSPAAQALHATSASVQDAKAGVAAIAMEPTETAPIQQARAVRHRRQSLAMPFYSFAPRS